MLEIFIGALVFFASGLAMLMAVLQLFSKMRRIANWLLFFLFLCTSLLLFTHYLNNYLIIYSKNSNLLLAYLLYPVNATNFLIGPLFYFFIESSLKSNFNLTLKKSLHFVLSIIAFIIIIIGTIFYYPDFTGLRSDHYLYFLSEAGVFHTIVYLLLGLQKFQLFKFILKKCDIKIKIVSLLSFWLLLHFISIFVSIIIRSRILSMITISATVALLIIVYLIGHKYPELLHYITKEVKKKQYEKSLLNGIDHEKLYERIKDLMEEEKLFFDEELNLNRLAGYLYITPQQLSEFLNNNLNTNFNNFLNKYRIEEAKKLLISEPHHSILSIAYSVGFNSKSVFYGAFSKFIGKTPLQYRDQYKT